MLAGLLIPIVGIGIAVAILGIIVTVARNYRKCPPNAVLVVFGRKHKMDVSDGQGGTVKKEVGYRLVIGGATFVVPMLESAVDLPLSTFQIQTKVTDTPNFDGVAVDVEAIANLKISSDPALLGAAVERLLSMKQQQLEQVAGTTLEAQLRQIVGTLTIEKMVKERESIQHSVLNVAKGELNKLGLDIDNFGIAKLGDKHGYIEALGKGKTAAVKRDAAIAEAEARREEDEKTAAARLKGETAKAESEKAISDANRDKEIAIADNQTQVQSRQARIPIIAASEAQDAQAELNRKTVAAQVAQVTADTDLQKLEQKRNEAKLDATTVTTARKEAEALIIKAQAGETAAAHDGEAARIKSEKEGLGTQAKMTAEADGRKAAASAAQAEAEATANGHQAMLLANAAGKKADGEAEGAAKLAVLLAEAEGLLKKNEALANLSDGARLIMILEQLPKLIEEAGEAGERIMGSMFEHVGAGLARIDNVNIVDMGSGGKNGDGNGAVANFALNIPMVVAGTLARFKALGLGVDEIAKKIGLDPSMLEKMMGGALGGALKGAVEENHGSADLAGAGAEKK